MLREAEEAMGRPEQFVDFLQVLEHTMRHFYGRALLLKQINGKPEQIDADLKEAAAIAEKIAPYRHARLSAVKLAGDPNNPVRIHDNASWYRKTYRYGRFGRCRTTRSGAYTVNFCFFA
jgi:hypothetical protein